MKNKAKMFGIIALAAVIALFTAACDNSGGGGGSEPGTPCLLFTLINGNTTYSVAMGTATATEIVIPAAYEGLPVTAIAEDGFNADTYPAAANITSITITNSVTTIGGMAFRNWTVSQTITVQGKANQTAADTAWGSDWRSFCNANITYQP